MALHSKWSSGDLIFYDGTQIIFTIQDDSEGMLVGYDGNGVDFKFFGDTTGAYMLWDESEDDLVFAGGAGLNLDGGDILLEDTDFLYFGDSKDMSMNWTTGSVFAVIPLVAKADLHFGTATLPVDVKFWGTTGSTEYMQWVSTGPHLLFDKADVYLGDTDFVKFGDSQDITMNWTTGGVFEILPAAAASEMYLGSTSYPLDMVNYGNITYRAPASPASTGAAVTLTSTSNRIQFISNATTDDTPVILPGATGAGTAGLHYTIFQTSTGGGDLIVYNSSSGGTTVATLSGAEGAVIISNGTVWRAIVGPET